LDLGNSGKFVLDGQEYLGTCLPHPVWTVINWKVYLAEPFMIMRVTG